FASDGLSDELIPHEELAECAGTALEEDGDRILSYGTGAGYTPLRELIAEQIGVHPFRVWVTAGWLQGFALLCQKGLTGRNVVLEFPTYNRALQVLLSHGINLMYLDGNQEWVNVELMAANLRTTNPKPSLAYLVPNFQNPTSRVIADEQRWELGKT